MFQIEVDKEFARYDTQLLHVRRVNNEMCVYDGDEVVLTIECPSELSHSFDILPEKRGYFRKDEMGVVHFTLIRFFDYHLHSEFSLLDGANKIKNIVAKSEGATAISDHGNCFGVLQLFKSMDAACKKSGVFIEVYCEDKNGHKDGNHLILGAKNEEGWKNICKIVSEAEGNFYRKPHVTWEMLEKYHEGLVCTSACLGGEIPTEILSNDVDSASETVEMFQGIFGDDFYLEIQDHHMGAEEDVVNNALLDMAFNLGIKCIAATDAHYTNKEDAYAHEVLLAIGTKNKMSDADRMRFSGDDYHLLSADEFEEKFLPYGKEVIENTLDMLDKCEFRFDLGKQDMPKFQIPDGFANEDEYFEHQCKVGFDERFPEGDARRTDPEYIERLDYEMNQIKKTGFVGYFLIVQDYVIWAKEHGIYVGPGRGSCVGSLACFCLKITELDPIPYGLLFERFINPERISPPDIDMDFEDTKRQDVIEYIKQKYGVEKVSNIITFGTLAARNVIRDVGRVLDSNSQMIDALAKSVPAEPKMTLAKAMVVSPDFKKMYDENPEAKEVVDIAEKLEGLSRQKSKHACGIIVSNRPIRDTVPEVLVEDKEDKTKKVVAGFNMVELEELGLLKMDFLGLRNMSILHLGIDSINDRFFSEEN